MILQFTVQEQTISNKRTTPQQKVVANSQNYLRAAFSFSEEWRGVITAVFEHPTLGAKAMLVGSDGTCLIPWEVIQPPCFFVGAFCGSRVTSNTAQIFVQPSVSLDTEATADPTPTIYEQIITMLENIGAGTGSGGVTVEKDPTVPAWVKAIQQADIVRWNHPPNPDLTGLLTKDEADAAYQPVGEYATQGDIIGLLRKADADEAYQPKGEYATPGDITGLLTKTDADEAYQPKGEYATQGDLAGLLDKTDADESYQPKGEYATQGDLAGLLTKTDAASTYQPKGNYQAAGSYMKTTDSLDISRLRDKSTDNTFGAETSGLTTQSINRLLYYKSDAILNADEVFRTGAYGVKNTDTHMPYLQWWYMICFCKNEEMRVCVQWAFPVRPENNGELWLRTCRGSENYYGAWKRVAITDQITALEQSVAALESART